MINGHRHLLCCAKGAMPEGGQTLSALRQFIYPSFAALTEDDMHVYARHAAAKMIRFGRMDADAALERLAQGIETVRKFNHPRVLDAVAIEGVGTCSDVLNRGAADLAREYDSLFVPHKSTSEEAHPVV